MGSEKGVKFGETFLWKGTLAFIWEVVRDGGDGHWGQTDLNSYPAYKLGVLREGTYTSLYFFTFLITFHIN